MSEQTVSTLIDQIVEIDADQVREMGITEGTEPMAFTPYSVTKATLYVHC